MITQHTIVDPPKLLKSDLAAEFPIYVYVFKDKKQLIYSTSLLELLDDNRVLKPLDVSEEGLSFLLQCGVVPPPNTIYSDVYIIGAGDSLSISTKGDKLALSFSYKFEFSNDNRSTPEDMLPDENHILELVAKSTISRIDSNSPTFMFHSAGKDSNTIALALAEAGWQEKVTLVTHKSKGDADESIISKSIADKLGFKHIVLNETLDYSKNIEKINDYFLHTVLPVLDSVTLAYPLYPIQLPELKGSNVIDGGGNDIYMCTPPSKRDSLFFNLAPHLSKFSGLLNQFTNSENKIRALTRTKAEWCGFSGFSYDESRRLTNFQTDTTIFFKDLQQNRFNWDSFDFKTSILTPIIASEMHIRKIRCATDYWGSNCILPFANQAVAEYFQKLPEAYQFDRTTRKNKLILRKILKNKIDLDSDSIGKKGYVFDYSSLLTSIFPDVTREIHSCRLWKTSEIRSTCKRLEYKVLNTNDNSAAKILYLRLYLVSAWLNRNKYIN